MADYESSAQIAAPDVGNVDVASGYEKYKAGISSFVDSLENIGTRYMDSKAKTAGAEDVQKGAFKSLPALSSTAIAYNDAGQQFEQSTSRMHLQSSAAALSQNIIDQRLKNNQPISDEDVKSFQNDYQDLSSNVLNSVSKESAPYVKNMAEMIGNQNSLSIQNKMDAQNKSLMQYSAMDNSNNLLNQTSQALQQGDHNAAINSFLQGVQSYDTTGTQALLGGAQAEREKQNYLMRGSRILGASLASSDMDSEQAVKTIHQDGAKMGLNEEQIGHALMSYNAMSAQQAQADGITAGAVKASLTANQKSLEAGNIADPNVLSSLGLQASKLRGSARIEAQAMVTAQNNASSNIQALKYAPPDVQEQEIRKLSETALNSPDHIDKMTASMTITAIKNTRDQAIKDPAAWAMGSPAMHQMMSTNRVNNDAQISSGHQLNTSNMNFDLPSARLEAERINKVPLAVLTNDEAKNTVSSIINAGDFKSGVGQLNNFLAQYKKGNTDSYAINDLLKNKLPVSYAVALNMDPQGNDLVNFGASMDPNFKPQSASGVGSQTWKMVKQSVIDSSSNFRDSIKNIDGPNAVQASDQMINAASRYAAFLHEHSGMDVDDASKKAINDVISSSYSFKSSLAIPKPYDAQKTLDSLDAKKSELLAYAQNPLDKNTFGYDQLQAFTPMADDARRRDFIQKVGNAHWALTGDNKGYVLMMPGDIPLKSSSNGLIYNYSLQDLTYDHDLRLKGK